MATTTNKLETSNLSNPQDVVGQIYGISLQWQKTNKNMKMVRQKQKHFLNHWLPLLPVISKFDKLAKLIPILGLYSILFICQFYPFDQLRNNL